MSTQRLRMQLMVLTTRCKRRPRKRKRRRKRSLPPQLPTTNWMKSSSNYRVTKRKTRKRDSARWSLKSKSVSLKRSRGSKSCLRSKKSAFCSKRGSSKSEWKKSSSGRRRRRLRSSSDSANEWLSSSKKKRSNLIRPCPCPPSPPHLHKNSTTMRHLTISQISCRRRL